MSYTPFNVVWLYQLQHFLTVFCVNQSAGLLHSGPLQALMG